jgi:hypothetical protein
MQRFLRNGPVSHGKHAICLKIGADTADQDAMQCPPLTLAEIA